MRLRTFTASDMPSAMNMVREALGENAIILASETSGKQVSVTAAIDIADDDTPTPPKPQLRTHGARDESVENLRFEIQNILRFHNLPEIFIAKILQKTPAAALSHAMAAHRIGGDKDSAHLHKLAVEKILAGYFKFSPLFGGARTSATRIMLIGTPGIGKTLTVAKIAAKMALEGVEFAVISTDNKRAGGIEQLQAFTNILGKELQVANSRTELWKLVKAQSKNTSVVVDTAGCNPYDPAEWKELQAHAGMEGIEPLLVLPAGGDSMEAVDMVEIFATLPIKRLLVTRADSARRFGGVMAAAAAHNLTFCNVSNSGSVADSLYPLDPALFAQLLMRYQLQTNGT